MHIAPIVVVAAAADSPIDFGRFWQLLFSASVLEGVVVTLLLSIFAQLLGSLIGLGLYFLRRSKTMLIRRLAELYIWLFRGTPLLVQIVVIWQVLAYIPWISGGSIGNQLDYGFDPSKAFNLVNSYFLSGIVGALLALSLNEGAYMAEIVRAGIDAIDTGQLEAAKSLGMTYGMGMRRIVLPQALRVIVPPLGNEFNSMLKSSSLAFVAGVFELFATTNTPGRSSGFYLTYMTVAVVWYLALTTAWGLVQSAIERRLNVSTIDPALRARMSFWQRLFGIGTGPTKGGPEPGAPIPAGIDRGAR